MYNKRLIDKWFAELLPELPAFLIEGAKGVGKTETAKQFSKTYHDLDNPVERAILESNPLIIASEEKPVLLDEWQNAPDLWNSVRHQIDNGLPMGSVIFTGSSIKVNSRIHSGAGRITSVKMRPFSIEERKLSPKYIRISDIFSNDTSEIIRTNLNLQDYIDEIFKSGFPGIRNLSERATKIQLHSYIDNIINHEFEENGFKVLKPQSLKAWLKAYAAASSTTTNKTKILEAAMKDNVETITRQTANSYQEALSILYIVDELPNFLQVGKLFPALSKSSKHYLMDPALVVSLLDVDKEDIAKKEVASFIGKYNETFLGQLFENFIYQSLVCYADYNEAELFSFRTGDGTHEIDFIMKKKNHLILFEVKTSASIDDKDVRHLNWFENLAQNEYQITKVAISSGSASYTRNDGVIVIPAGLLGA